MPHILVDVNVENANAHLEIQVLKHDAYDGTGKGEKSDRSHVVL